MPYASSSFEKEQLFHSKKQESYLAIHIWRRPSLAPVVTSLLLFAGTFFLFNSLFASLDNDYGGASVSIYALAFLLLVLIIFKQPILEGLLASLIQSA